MTKQNFLAMSLYSGLKVRLNQKGKFNLDEECPSPHDEICEITQIINCGDHFEYEISDGNVSYGFIEEDEFDIIARHLPDLTKEIEHNGERFVPLVELAKVAYKKLNWNCFIEDGCCYLISSTGKREYTFFYCKSERSFITNSFPKNEQKYIPYQLDLFQKLFEWHFDIAELIEKGEAIDINTIENPYK